MAAPNHTHTVLNPESMPAPFGAIPDHADAKLVVRVAKRCQSGPLSEASPTATAGPTGHVDQTAKRGPSTELLYAASLATPSATARLMVLSLFGREV
ncbi:hypothetical protein DPMN_113020 [Dreissena polymorpha]|uniref:Uncharacterized protein n=1 Tax=Dreissena polymorpha TaxID=45954 RepID=A0A9D4KGS9_DREPO|nr:hypothetical protein DPMN_113020 [Dreissena polymorpha]